MEELYKKYSLPVYRYLYSLTNNHELSEELMQETFCSAIQGIKKFRGECSIYSWLCEIAKNKWRNSLKKGNKVKLVQFDENIDKLLIYGVLEYEVNYEIELNTVSDKDVAQNNITE